MGEENNRINTQKSRSEDDALDELSRVLFKDEPIEVPEDIMSKYRKYEESIITNERVSEGSRLREKEEKKKKSAGGVFRSIVLIVAVIAFLGSGAVLAKRGVEYIKMRKTETQIEGMTISDDDLLGIDTTDENALELLIEKYPQLAGVNFPANFNFRYALLYATNPEFVGYLKIDGTSINTAVVQHNDDDYYYDHDFYGKESVYGAIFALSHNNMVNLDQNTVLIGHHMKDGSRFHDLVTYKTIEGYKTAPIIEFNTPYNDYKWKVYGAFILNGAPSGDNGYKLDCLFNNVSTDSFARYIEEINKRTLYTTGVDLLPTDKILTLMTCTYEFTNARLIVIARMVRPGEDASTDLSLVQPKSAPIKYPQALYDKRSKTNPYADDEKWYPY